MHRVAVAATLLFTLSLLQVTCEDDAVFGDPQTTSTSASSGQGGSQGGGPGSGGAPSCEDFGDPCTTCTVDSAVCNQTYCDCVGDPECGGLWQCLLGCAQDPMCSDDCELMYPDAYAQLLLMLDCMGGECSAECNGLMPFGGCFKCWLTDCSTALNDCVADAECNEYIDCIAACTEAGCPAACYDALTDTTLADALFTCVQNNCQDAGECGTAGQCQPLGTPCSQCAYDSPVCNVSYCGCFANADCGGYAQCINACMPGDEVCADNCELTNSGGYSAFYQMLGCMGAECSGDCGFGAFPACFDCLVNDCSASLDGCQGDMECNEWLDCTTQCMNMQCQAQCYAAMTDTTEADAFIACFQGTCGTDCGP
jgi:hypothetical protein